MLACVAGRFMVCFWGFVYGRQGKTRKRGGREKGERQRRNSFSGHIFYLRIAVDEKSRLLRKQVIGSWRKLWLQSTLGLALSGFLEKMMSVLKSQIKGVKPWRQGPTLGVRFTEVSILCRCPLRESRPYLRTSPRRIKICQLICF